MMENSAQERGQRKGLPIIAVCLIAVAALLVGGVAGFLTGGASAGKLRAELDATNATVVELESALYYATGDERYEEGAVMFRETDSSDNNFALTGSSKKVLDWGSATVVSPAPTKSVVAVEYVGGQIMSDSVLNQYAWEIGNPTSGVEEDKLLALMEDMAENGILRMKAGEMGLLNITQADENAIARRALGEYAELGESDLTLDELADSIRADWWREKLYAAVTQDSEDPEAAWDTQLAAWIEEADVQFYPERL